MTSLVVLGPNLIDQSKGSFHVHAAGCRDLGTYYGRQHDADKANPVDFDSESDVVEYVYADQIAEDPEGNAVNNLLSDFYFFPCVEFAPKKEAVVKTDTKTVTILRKITFEVYKNGMFFNMEVFATKANFSDALSEIFAMRNSRNIAY
jgi:hypothetical protein